ncbi:hypothetical protein NDU88_000610 [Pleurodeles waltl]|uniref:Uncharacterized protein n=1 Tax=Pleurodeles waltl TaxID=8319 RepID=A0AAV7KN61_PLEWA|nr:hypothetical protein NDU88_000610 [Pleurodeles waltl]
MSHRLPASPPLQMPSVTVFALLLGPVTPQQATLLLEGPRTPGPRLHTAGHLRAAADCTQPHHQEGGPVGPPPPFTGTPLRVCPVPIGTHSPGPPRPQPGPTTTASLPGVTSCSDSCRQAGPILATSRRGPRGPQAQATPVADASFTPAASAQHRPRLLKSRTTPQPEPQAAARGGGAPLLLFAAAHTKNSGRGRQRPQSQARHPRRLPRPTCSLPRSIGPPGRPQVPASCGRAHPRPAASSGKAPGRSASPRPQPGGARHLMSSLLLPAAIPRAGSGEAPVPGAPEAAVARPT